LRGGTRGRKGNQGGRSSWIRNGGKNNEALEKAREVVKGKRRRIRVQVQGSKCNGTERIEDWRALFITRERSQQILREDDRETLRMCARNRKDVGYEDGRKEEWRMEERGREKRKSEVRVIWGEMSRK